MAIEFRLLQSKLNLGKTDDVFLRTDGRALTERRTVAINVGSVSTADGSALIKLGCTTVICGIKAELASPSIDNPRRGFLVPNVELPPLCFSQFKSGPPTDQEQVLSQLMLEILESANFLDLEKLCIIDGKLVWCLYADMVCLDYDGNLNEACVLALSSALQSLTLPKVEYDGDLEIASLDWSLINVSMERENVLEPNSVPLAVTFAALDDQRLIVDPTYEEERLLDEAFTVALNPNGSLCHVHKPGGTPIDPDKLIELVEKSGSLVAPVRTLLNKACSNKGTCVSSDGQAINQ